MQIYFSSFLVGGLLICGLIILLALRFLVHKRAKVDSIVMASPIVLVFSIFYIFAFGANIITLSLFILTFFVFLTNYRALQRFANGLYVDYYHAYFSITSFLEALCTIVFIVFFVIYAPVSDTPTNGFSVSRTNLTGSAAYGLSEKTKVFQSTNAIVYEYTGDSGVDETKPILLYVPDLFCQSSDFEPILGAFAREGYRVIAMDIKFSDITYLSKFLDNRFVKPFAMRIQKVSAPEKFEENLQGYIQKKGLEIKAAKNFLEKKYENKNITFLADTYTSEAIKGLFLPENIIEYNWGGCGLLSETLPLEYKIFISQN